MKGITNYEMREFFETISQDVKDIKTKKASTADTTLFLIATVSAITATLLYVLNTNPLLLFFIISSLASMAVILVKSKLESSD